MIFFRTFAVAVERVERRLRRVTAVLNAAGIRYAVVGGNAVAAWVARADPSATRTTKGVDLVVERRDLDRITVALSGIAFERQDLRDPVLFIDPDEPSRRAGVHLVWADECVRPSYLAPAPSVDEVELAPEGFRILALPALVRMKLTSYRDIDRVHIADLLEVGLIDDGLRSSLPPELQERLRDIERKLGEQPDRRDVAIAARRGRFAVWT